MSTPLRRSSQGRRSSNNDLKPIITELEALTIVKEEGSLPSSRKNSKSSGQVNVETDGADEVAQPQLKDEVLETEEPEEEAISPDGVEKNLEEEQTGTESLRGSAASVAASKKSAADQGSPKEEEKSSKKLKIAFSEPQSFIQSTTSHYRVTRMFDSISVRKRRQSSVALKPVLKFQPTYRLESSNPFSASYVRDFLGKFIEDRMEEIGKVDFSKEKHVRKICERLSMDILQKIKAKEFDRYKIMVNVTLIEKFHQGFCNSIGCMWDPETDAMVTNVYERKDLCVITAVFGIYYD